MHTRGHARFARSPLVIRLGHSRIRRGNSGFGEVFRGGIKMIDSQTIIAPFFHSKLIQFFEF